MIELRAFDLATLEAQVRAAPGDVLVRMDAGLHPIALAAMRAAIGPLAVACAPDRRVNALVCDAGAADEDIAAAIAWLRGAASTTGQVLEIGGPQS